MAPRPNLFQCRGYLSLLVGVAAGGNAATAACIFYVELQSLPGTTINTIDVPYRGRMIHIAGDREYETWPSYYSLMIVTMTVRNAFEAVGRSHQYW